MVLVGALNVGSVELNFDPELKTNTSIKRPFSKTQVKFYGKADGSDILSSSVSSSERELFKTAAANNQVENFDFSDKGVYTPKGAEIGRFNMGSTICLIFEAEPNFKFNVKEGQQLNYGELLGRVENWERERER